MNRKEILKQRFPFILQLFLIVLVNFCDRQGLHFPWIEHIPNIAIIILIIIALLTGIYAMVTLKHQKNVFPENKHIFKLSVCWFVILLVRSIDMISDLW